MLTYTLRPAHLIYLIFFVFPNFKQILYPSPNFVVLIVFLWNSFLPILLSRIYKQGRLSHGGRTSMMFTI